MRLKLKSISKQQYLELLNRNNVKIQNSIWTWKTFVGSCICFR